MTIPHWSQIPPVPRPSRDGSHRSDPSPSSADGAQVLLVDASADNREVLRTALQRRGIGTFATGHPAYGLAWARQNRPTLIVLDTEWDPAAGDDVCRQYAEANHAPMLMLGTLPPDTASPTDGTARVPKPYHYAPLIRKIEEMIAEAKREGRRNFHSE